MDPGCPSILRSDCGTENTVLSACHMTLRHNHMDEFKGEKSFRFGSSATNTVKFVPCCFHYLNKKKKMICYIHVLENRELVGPAEELMY